MTASAAAAQQRRYTLTPLDRPARAETANAGLGGCSPAPSSTATFVSDLAAAMAADPPPPRDAPIVADLASAGIGPGLVPAAALASPLLAESERLGRAARHPGRRARRWSPATAGGSCRTSGPTEPTTSPGRRPRPPASAPTCPPNPCTTTRRATGTAPRCPGPRPTGSTSRPARCPPSTGAGSGPSPLYGPDHFLVANSIGRYSGRGPDARTPAGGRRVARHLRLESTRPRATSRTGSRRPPGRSRLSCGPISRPPGSSIGPGGRPPSSPAEVHAGPDGRCPPTSARYRRLKVWAGLCRLLGVAPASAARRAPTRHPCGSGHVPDRSGGVGPASMTTITMPASQPGATRRRRGLGIERGLLQLVVLLWCYALYDVLRTSVSGAMATALTHAAQITEIERVAGINIERIVQHAALQMPGLVDACNVCYSLTHLLAPPVVLVVLYRRAPQRYRPARNALLLLLGVALLCFWLYPVAPPRLVPGPSHLADTTQTLQPQPHPVRRPRRQQERVDGARLDRVDEPGCGDAQPPRRLGGVGRPRPLAAPPTPRDENPRRLRTRRSCSCRCWSPATTGCSTAWPVPSPPFSPSRWPIVATGGAGACAESRGGRAGDPRAGLTPGGRASGRRQAPRNGGARTPRWWRDEVASGACPHAHDRHPARGRDELTRTRPSMLPLRADPVSCLGGCHGGRRDDQSQPGRRRRGRAPSRRRRPHADSSSTPTSGPTRCSPTRASRSSTRRSCSVGGGIGSFVFTDYLRVAGVPAANIRVLSTLDQPWQTYQYLTQVSQIPAQERLRSDSASTPGCIWGFPSYGVREAWREKTLAPLWSALDRADPHRLLDAEGRSGLRRPRARGRPHLVLGLPGQGPGADGPPPRRRRVLHDPHAARRDEPHQARRLPEHLRAPRRGLPRREVPARPPGLPPEVPGVGARRERLRAPRARLPAAAAPPGHRDGPGERHRRVADLAAPHRRPRPRGAQTTIVHLFRTYVDHVHGPVDLPAAQGRGRMVVPGLQLAQVGVGRPGPRQVLEARGRGPQGGTTRSSAARTRPTASSGSSSWRGAAARASTAPTSDRSAT